MSVIKSDQGDRKRLKVTYYLFFVDDSRQSNSTPLDTRPPHHPPYGTIPHNTQDDHQATTRPRWWSRVCIHLLLFLHIAYQKYQSIPLIPQRHQREGRRKTKADATPIPS
jgi:hypothetical protein